MTPIEQAAAVYQREACARSFEDDLYLHFINGFVFSTPQYFMMGRPVIKEADHHLIVDPAHVFTPEDCNAWHIYLAAGQTEKAWGIMPWPLGYFTFERKNELRTYPVERIRKLSTGERLTST